MLNDFALKGVENLQPTRALNVACMWLNRNKTNCIF